MQLLEIWQALGIGFIYIGFSFALGHLIQGKGIRKRSRMNWIGLCFTLLAFLPATAMLLGLETWSLPARLLLCGAGWLTIGLTATQPAWVPGLFWRRSFHRSYLALAMALVSAWGLSAWLAYASSAAMLIGLAALTAGSSSARSMLTA
jgi:hypothetical protein